MGAAEALGEALNPDVTYLDYNATTPVAEEVLGAMEPWFRSSFGNASSAHAMGVVANRAVEEARRSLADLLGSAPSEIVFTSGATESNNLALKGVLPGVDSARRRLLIGATEHKSVSEVAQALVVHGWQVQEIPVDRFGVVQVEALEDLLDDRVAVISVMAANNETGTLNPIEEVAQAAHDRGALVHTDATQWVGKLPTNVRAWGVDLLSLSAHKLYGPKGVGALYIKKGTQLATVTHGGGHERGFRAGTLNTPGIVGFGVAARLSAAMIPESIAGLSQLRDLLWQTLAANLEDVRLNGHPELRLPNTLNVRITGVEADSLIAQVPTLAISSGSACTSAVPSPSPTLTGMGLSRQEADESIRVSLGRETTVHDVHRAADIIVSAAKGLRALTTVGTRVQGS